MISKYPRTKHLPWSPGFHGDDLKLTDINHLLNKSLVITEKIDGECTAIFSEGCHARSIDSKMTPWRNVIAAIHGKIKHLLKPNEIIYGENMFAVHAIEYEKLDDYFYVFNIIQDDIFLSWEDIEKRSKEIGLKTVPLINNYPPINSTKELEKNLKDCIPLDSYYGSTVEGFVVRNAESFHRSEFDLNASKFVRDGHCGTSTTAHWTKNWKKANLSH